MATCDQSNLMNGQHEISVETNDFETATDKYESIGMLGTSTNEPKLRQTYLVKNQQGKIEAVLRDEDVSDIHHILDKDSKTPQTSAANVAKSIENSESVSWNLFEDVSKSFETQKY